MSVKFKAVGRVNPRDLTLPMKYYPQIVYGDDVSFDELVILISKLSNLNYGSVAGALGTLIEVIQLQLTHGRQVRLGDLGTLFLTLSGTGQETAAAMSSADITKASIRFRPGRKLKKVASSLDFEKVADPSATEDSDTVAAIADTVS